MDADFFVDTGTALLLSISESWCDDSERNEETCRVRCCRDPCTLNRETCRFRIIQLRIILGILFNIAGFIVVVAVNHENYKESNAANGFFIVIVSFTVIYYGGFLFLLHTVLRQDGNEKETGLQIMIIYRVLEIEFDIFVLIYSLILSEWEMTDFTIATTVLASVDIGVSISSLFKNFYDTKNRYFSIILIIIFVFFLLLFGFGCCWVCFKLVRELPSISQTSAPVVQVIHAETQDNNVQVQNNQAARASGTRTQVPDNQARDSGTQPQAAVTPGQPSGNKTQDTVSVIRSIFTTNFWLRNVVVVPTSLGAIIIGHVDKKPDQDETVEYKCVTRSPKKIYDEFKQDVETIDEAAFSKIVVSFGLDEGDTDLDIVKFYMSKTMEKVQNKFIGAKIGICRSSLRPQAARRQMFDDLNTFIRKICKENKYCDIDTPEFDSEDVPSGNEEGLHQITLRIQNFINNSSERS